MPEKVVKNIKYERREAAMAIAKLVNLSGKWKWKTHPTYKNKNDVCKKCGCGCLKAVIGAWLNWK